MGREIVGDEKSIATIFKIPAEGGEAQKITTASDNVTEAGLDWSPDSQKIAFSGESGMDIEFWFMEDFLPLVKGRK